MGKSNQATNQATSQEVTKATTNQVTIQRAKATKNEDGKPTLAKAESYVIPKNVIDADYFASAVNFHVINFEYASLQLRYDQLKTKLDKAEADDNTDLYLQTEEQLRAHEVLINLYKTHVKKLSFYRSLANTEKLEGEELDKTVKANAQTSRIMQDNFARVFAFTLCNYDGVTDSTTGISDVYFTGQSELYKSLKLYHNKYNGLLTFTNERKEAFKTIQSMINAFCNADRLCTTNKAYEYEESGTKLALEPVYKNMITKLNEQRTDLVIQSVYDKIAWKKSIIQDCYNSEIKVVRALLLHTLKEQFKCEGLATTSKVQGKKFNL